LTRHHECSICCPLQHLRELVPGRVGQVAILWHLQQSIFFFCSHGTIVRGLMCSYRWRSCGNYEKILTLMVLLPFLLARLVFI
jgi:hypothetical protein